MARSLFEAAQDRRNAPHAPRTNAENKESRNRLYRAIRAACRRRGMDDDDRRGAIHAKFSKSSMTALSPLELGQFLDHLNANYKGPMAHRAHVAKIKALWWSLYWLGEVDDPDDKAMDAFVKRQTGVAAVRFLDHVKAPAVIEALKSWLERAGVSWPGKRDTDLIAANTPDFTPGRHDRHRVLDLIAARLGRADWRELLIAGLGIGPKRFAWTEHELDMAIRHLGRELRRAGKKAVVA